MRKLFLVTLIFAMAACYRDNETRTIMNVSKYKGYVIKSQIANQYKYFDTYVLQKGDTIVKEQFPTMFADVYKVGDTIK